MLSRYLKTNFMLLLALAIPALIFIFTLGRYYGFYYDNHQFNLLALDLMENFRPYFYFGNTYSIHSTLYSYIAYPLFYIFGPTDFSMEIPAAFFHLAVILACWKLGARFFNKEAGIIFAFLVSLAPIYIINIYTWQENSLIAFLNILSIYYFLAGFQEISRCKIIAGSIFYILSCFQSIYSLALLPFFFFYSLIQVFLLHKNYASVEQNIKRQIKNKFFQYLSWVATVTAFLYLVFLLGSMLFVSYTLLYYTALCLLTLMIGLAFYKLPESTREIIKFCFLFCLTVAIVLILLDLFVQLDVLFFNAEFGYYRDTTYAGGFDSRPIFVFRGKAVELFGKRIYSSVLSSLVSLSYYYSQVSFGASKIWQLIFSYYKKCFPLPILFFFITGLIGLFVEIMYTKYKKKKLETRHIFPLVWFLAITISFINTNPHHMLRIFIMPMPYFFASLGIYYLSGAIKYIYAGLFRIRGQNVISNFLVVLIILLLSVSQFNFLVRNIYLKYKSDKIRSNYFQLFNGWPYGRTYKEVGEFLLKDAPLKKDGKFRSIFIYTISPLTSAGICAIFYNNIDWYTQNKIKILYDDIYSSYQKYGTRSSLIQYLDELFSTYPNVEVIYFADFYDTKDNFSFFSKVHKNIGPYTIVDDDNSLEYDCILYKFGCNTWQEQFRDKE